ncbi:Lysine decarboxylase family protein [Enhygromyxa salina]|uniref:Cytokinin riboside 5'-monophosphate phosphoribohydrolase n=1 Tax=Enhygromyxa salina TaxID=215803 RepID=A0A0C2CUV1_9BACT|nr:TIGR00730 family Rossman fold protein [Enhygromyxa salina]KIG14901.1 Lysine decarboxylase family protein [Enhygromyxa salina]
MQRICVFCGSAAGVSPAYAQAAKQFGQALAGRGLGLVFGGGNVGLMGAVANAALEAGAEVIGVLPKALQAREPGHQGLTQLHVVAGMHERKAMMAELCDGFVALPGGLGTLEELFEVWTWAMLGFHRKPVCLLDVGGYWAPLLAMVERMVDDGFVIAAHRRMLIVDDRIESLLDKISEYQPPQVPRWIGDGET